MRGIRLRVIPDPKDQVPRLIALTRCSAETRLGPDLVCDPPPRCSEPRLVWAILRSLGKRRSFCSPAKDSWDQVDAWVKAERIRRIFVMRAHCLHEEALERLREKADHLGPEVWLVDSTGTEYSEWEKRWNVEVVAPESFANVQEAVARVRSDEPDEVASRDQQLHGKWIEERGLGDPPEALMQCSAFGFFTSLDRHLTKKQQGRFKKAISQALLVLEASSAPAINRELRPTTSELLQRRFHFLMAHAPSEAARLIRLRATQIVAFKNGWHLENPGIHTLNRVDYSPPGIDQIRQLADPESAAIAALGMVTGLHPCDLSSLRWFKRYETDYIHLFFEGTPLAVPSACQTTVRAHVNLLINSSVRTDDSPENFVFRRASKEPSKLWHRLGAANPWKSPDQIMKLAHDVQTKTGWPIFHSSWAGKQGIALRSLQT